MAADLWLQIDVGLPSSKLVDRIRAECGVSTNEAIGLLVRLWIAAMKVGCGGDLRGRSNMWIEEEEGWRGESGVFAKAVHTHHLENGVIRDWSEKYGRLEAIRAEATRIKRAQRSRPKDEPEDRPPDSPPAGPPDIRVDTRVDSYSSASAVLSASQVKDQKPVVKEREPGNELPVRRDVVLDFVAEFDFGPFAPIVEGYLRSTKRIAAVMATIRMHALGELGHEKATHRELGLAIQQYAANEEARGFNAKYFAGHVRDAKKGVVVVENRERNTAEQRHIDTEARAATARDREHADADKLLDDFKAANPNRYAELERMADGLVPKKFTVGREFMTRGQLITLVRAEGAHAS